MTIPSILTGLMQQQSPEHFQKLNTIRQLALIANALDDARDYFANRADVKGDAGDMPNEEMSLQIDIERAQEALGQLREGLGAFPRLAVNNEKVSI